MLKLGLNTVGLKNRAYLGSTLVFDPTPAPENEYAASNAASVINEANSIGDWTLFYGTGTIESSNTGATPTNGSRFLKFTHTGANNTELDLGEPLSGIVNGQSYTIQFDANRIARPSGNGTLTAYIYSDSSGLLEDVSIAAAAGWNAYEITFTADAGPIYFGCYWLPDADTGDTVAIDNVRLYKN